MRAFCLLLLAVLCAQGQLGTIAERIRGLRQLPNDTRAQATRDLALEIRRLPATDEKVSLAINLASLATEGDFGSGTLQEVATTLAAALEERPAQSSMFYTVLAQLARYEHVSVTLRSPRYEAALAALEAAEQRRQRADFTLPDLDSKPWTLSALRGKVVLVNFWVTWCPPCRKEMPDLEALYNEFKDRGLVVLAVSDDDPVKVRRFIGERRFTYPVLLDSKHEINRRFEIEGIPKTFIYDRQGKLVAQAIDMRTRRQFLDLLAEAGLKEER
jgi:peroxiredoxin